MMKSHQIKTRTLPDDQERSIEDGIAVMVNVKTEGEFEGGGGGDIGSLMDESFGGTWGFSICFLCTLWIVFASVSKVLNTISMYS